MRNSRYVVVKKKGSDVTRHMFAGNLVEKEHSAKPGRQRRMQPYNRQMVVYEWVEVTAFSGTMSVGRLVHMLL